MTDINELERLVKLKESGALSEEEFQAQKAEILQNESKPKKYQKIRNIVVILLTIWLGWIIINSVITGVSKNSAALSKPETPSCADESVKNLVIETLTAELKNELAGIWTYEDLKEAKNKRGKMYEALINNGEKEESIIKTASDTLTMIDGKIGTANLHLEDILINAKYEDIKKYECSGILAFSTNKTHPINYDVQLTEDQKIYTTIANISAIRRLVYSPGL